MNKTRRFSSLSYIFLMVFLWLSPIVRIYAQDGGRDQTIIEITAPVDGAVISGQVVITGSAGHPTQFAGYELEFDNLLDPNEVWLPIAPRISTPVTNGTLGIWDTVERQVADGSYRIRLRIFLLDPNEPPVEFIVNNVQLVNTLPTPLPTIQPQPPTPTFFFGPTPTSLVAQPPTLEPRPTFERPVDVVETDRQDETISVNFDSLTGAFCNGMIVAFIFFAIIGGYLFTRARLRPVARQTLWQMRHESDEEDERS